MALTANDLATTLRQVLAGERSLSQAAASLEALGELIGTDGFRELDGPARSHLVHLGGLVVLQRGRTSGSRADLDRAVDWLELAESGARQDGSEARAQVAANLALALLERFENWPEDDSLSDLHRGGALLAVAIPMLGDRAAVAWHTLGLIERECFGLTGVPGVLDNAIAAFRIAVRDSTDRVVAAGYRHSLASALWRSWQIDPRRPRLDEALTLWIDATADVDDETEEWSSYATGLANGLLDRAEADGRPEDARRAIGLFEQCLGRYDAGSARWRRTASNLGNALWVESRLSGDTASVHRAVAQFEAALGAMSDDDPDRAAVLSNSAAAHHELYERTGSLVALERAIEVGESLIGAPHAAVKLSHRQNLAVAMLARYKRLDDPDDLDRVIALLTEGLAVGAPGVDAAAASGTRANALQLRYDRNGDREDLDAAVAGHERALALSVGQPLDEALARSNLGVVLAARAQIDPGGGDLHRAVSEQQIALAQVPTASPLRARVECALADSLALRASATGAATDVVATTTAYRRATRIGLRSLPEQAVGAAASWLEWASARGAWAEAVEAGRAGIRAIQVQFDAHELAPHKETWLRAVQGLPQGTAYALAALGRVRAATEVVERGRALLLNESLQHRAQARPGRTRPISERVIYLVPSTTGGMALIRTADGRRSAIAYRAVPLADMTVDGVEAHLKLLADAYRQRRARPLCWRRAMDEIGRWAWDAVIGPVTATLERKSSTILVPTGLAAGVPFHAAWTTDRSAPTGRRYFLDETAVAYTPNLAWLRATTPPRPEIRGGRVLVVWDPEPTSLPALAGAAREVEVAANSDLGATILRGAAATRSGLLEALADTDVLHVACHGRSDRVEPRDSALYLAGDEPVTVTDLLASSASGVGLAVLSSCESAVIGDPVPDEVVGLPVALLQAGVRTVVATQWAVPDLPTAVLIADFYNRWRHGSTPAEALRAAQVQLRDATNADLVGRYGKPFSTVAPEDFLARRLWDATRPFAAPTTWAASTVIGCGFW